jgi:hypothetical protein
VGGAENSTATIAITSNSAWTVNDNAEWLSVSPTSGDGSGEVTVTAQANTTSGSRPAIITFTYGNAQTQTVAVTQALAPPTYAASTQTWAFDTQTWSDAIQACASDNLGESITEPHCYIYTYQEKVYHYYNFAYVTNNAATLCPSPWKVPAMSDATTLISGSPDLLTAWGPGGNYNFQSNAVDEGAFANGSLLWTSTSAGDYATFFGVVNWGTPGQLMVSEYGNPAVHGFQVRCVLGE